MKKIWDLGYSKTSTIKKNGDTKTSLETTLRANNYNCSSKKTNFQRILSNWKSLDLTRILAIKIRMNNPN